MNVKNHNKTLINSGENCCQMRPPIWLTKSNNDKKERKKENSFLWLSSLYLCLSYFDFTKGTRHFASFFRDIAKVWVSLDKCDQNQLKRKSHLLGLKHVSINVKIMTIHRLIQKIFLINRDGYFTWLLTLPIGLY